MNNLNKGVVLTFIYFILPLEVDRNGFFSGRCRYLEIRAADGRYMMLIVLADFPPSSHKCKCLLQGTR